MTSRASGCAQGQFCAQPAETVDLGVERCDSAVDHARGGDIGVGVPALPLRILD
ncbi:hypothetical protein ACFYVK_32345 [Streptomyces chartreusis]|uniref:hypothetical protein n=1 Tax=Streptomyces chartreusis TaxID=1969 RepID=UPI00369ECC71